MGGSTARGYERNVSCIHSLCFLVFCLLFSQPLSAATINGTSYVSVKTVAQRLGMAHTWISAEKQARISSKWSRVDFTVNKRDVVVSGVNVHLGFPVALHRGSLHISESDYQKTLLPVLAPQGHKPVPKLYHIVIDPGHGGKDAGAVNRSLGVLEKDLALDISTRLGKILASRGYKVSYTRTTDKALSLDERGAFANRLNADLFVSVHLNAFSSSSVSGVETFAFTPKGQPSTATSSLRAQDRQGYPGNQYDSWNTLMAYNVQRELAKLGSRDRGVKRARFAVLRNTTCTAILVEGGFVSNSSEGRRLKQASYRQNIAQSIADGIHQYQLTINRIRKNQ